MLLEQKVLVKWRGSNVKRYKELGYKYTFKDDTFYIDIKELSRHSEARIKFKCDYCGDIVETSFKNYMSAKEREMVHKDSCKKCARMKFKESNLIKYGVEHPMQIAEVSERSSASQRGYDIKAIKELFKEKGLELVTTTYRNNKQNLEYICKKHKEQGIQAISLNRFLKSKFGCKYCGHESAASKRKLDFKYVANKFKEKSYILVSKEYINDSTPLEYICPKHRDKGIQKITFNDLTNKSQNRGCKYCGDERKGDWCKVDFSEVKKIVLERGYILACNELDYSGLKSKISYICPKHKENGIQNMNWNNFKKGAGCRYCGRERINESNRKWNNQERTLYLYLRDQLNDWKNKSMEACDYKCVITGGKFDEVHHLHGFSAIFKETLQELNVPLRNNISDYSLGETKLMTKKILEVHYRYPLGVCLRNDVHTLFHKIYGKGDNTIEQFEEFKKNYNYLKNVGA